MLDTQSLTESFLVLLYFDALFPTLNRGEPDFQSGNEALWL
jgi:hypothetical protein